MDSFPGIIAGIPGGRLRLLPNSAASWRTPFSSAVNLIRSGGGCKGGFGISGWERTLPAEDDFGLLFAAEGCLLVLVADSRFGGGAIGGAGPLTFS